MRIIENRTNCELAEAAFSARFGDDGDDDDDDGDGNDDCCYYHWSRRQDQLHQHCCHCHYHYHYHSLIVFLLFLLLLLMSVIKLLRKIIIRFLYASPPPPKYWSFRGGAGKVRALPYPGYIMGWYSASLTGVSFLFVSFHSEQLLKGTLHSRLVLQIRDIDTHAQTAGDVKL